MPHLKIHTNLEVSEENRDNILSKSSKLVASELSKPEEFVMITLKPSAQMIFAGTRDPVAFLELTSVGLPAKKTKELSRVLCELIETELSVSKQRVYVKFIDVHHSMWGWKGDTF